MDSNQIKALKQDTNDRLLNLTAVTYKDGKEQPNWIEFLKSGLFTYKYPFSEQLQLYTQTQSNSIRPRAIADLDIWNNFGYKLKEIDATPISIVDLNGTAPGNPKRVYDISQLERKDGRDEELPFKLWDKDLTPEKAEHLKTVLIDKYGLNSDSINESNLSTVLLMCLESKYQRVSDENKGKFGVGENMSQNTYDEIVVTAFFSAQIMVMARLGSKAGINNDEILSFYKMIHDNLPKINTKETITALGEMTNIFAKEMFTEIEIEVKKYERELKNAREELNHEQTGLDDVGQNAVGISEGVQPRGVSEVDGAGVTADPLHGDTEPNAGVHRKHDEPNNSVSEVNWADARQDGTAVGMDTGNEQHTADGEGNSHQGSDRGQLVDETEEPPVMPTADNHVKIATILGFDPDKYGKPWVCAVSRGRNYFTTKEGSPIGGFTGNATDGIGGDLYVINPQEGRIYGYGHKNKEDSSKSLTAYAKYQDGGFLPCDRSGKLIEAVIDTNLDENIEPENKAEVEQANNPINHVIFTYEDFDVSLYHEPKAYLLDKNGNPISTAYNPPIEAGGFTGDKYTGDGGDLYVTDPKEGQVFMCIQRGRLQVGRRGENDIAQYVKFINGSFHECDKYGQLNEPFVNENPEQMMQKADEAIEPTDETLPTTENTVLIDETPEHTEASVESSTETTTDTEMPLKFEWETYIEKRTTGLYAQQYTEPIVLIEFSENPNFGGENSLNFQGYEELSFFQADRKFKEVEAEARAERIKRFGELGGYDKTYGVILYKDHPNDEELSTYQFRYDICDYDEQQSGLFNHINGFWKYNEEQIRKGEFSAYKQENVDNAKRMLSIIEPYSAQARTARLNEYFELFPPHQETRAVGEKVLLPMLYENGNLNRNGKRTRVTVEEPIGKYQIYSEGGENDNERYAFIMTPANKLINIATLNQVKGENINKIDIERRIDERIILGHIDHYDKNTQDPAAFIDYRAAAVLNRVEEAEAYNAPVVEARQRQRDKENEQREEERKQEEMRIAQEKAEHENLGGFGDDGSMTPLQKSKAASFLKDNKYATREYGYLSNKEFVEKVISEGYVPERRVSLKKKYAEMYIGESEDGSNFKSSEIRSRIRQINQDNLGIDSPQAQWLKLNSPLTYYKMFKNNGLPDNGKEFLESPEMKPYVSIEYAFSKPLEKEGQFYTFPSGIGKTHFDYGNFLLKVNPVIQEKGNYKLIKYHMGYYGIDFHKDNIATTINGGFDYVEVKRIFDELDETQDYPMQSVDIGEIANEQEAVEIDKPQEQQEPPQAQETQQTLEPQKKIPSTVIPKDEPKIAETPPKTAPVQPSGIFATLPERHADADVKGKYSDTHFRIRKNGYDSSGRSDWENAVKIAYEKEVTEILAVHGWIVQPSERNGAAPTAIKGKNYLYLHPQDFSGVCENAERESLFEAFKNAETFECNTVDVYREIHDMTDEELLEKLNGERETIENELLEAFTTKRSNLYVSSVGFFGVDGNIGKRHSVKRLAMEGKNNHHGVDNRTDGICATFAGEVFKSLVDSGKIVSSRTKNGIGYRKANEHELNQMQLSDFTQDNLFETQETQTNDIRVEETENKIEPSLLENIRNDLSERGFAVSDELIEDGYSDYLAHNGKGDFQDIADFIEDEYLSEEPEAEQEKDVDVDENTITRNTLLAKLYSLNEGDTFSFVSLGDNVAENVRTDFAGFENGTRMFTHTAPSGSKYSYTLDELLKEVYPRQDNVFEILPMFNEKTITAEEKTPTLQGNPMWGEYQALTAEHNDKILFVQVGDFYEVLGDNAVVAAKTLNIANTGRDVGLPQRVPMCGIPNFKLDEYIALLNQNGYGVVVKNNDGTINVYADEKDKTEQPSLQADDTAERQEYDLDIFPMGGNGIVVYDRSKTDMSKYKNGHVLLPDIENDDGIFAHIHHERYVVWHSENIPEIVKSQIREIAENSDSIRLISKTELADRVAGRTAYAEYRGENWDNNLAGVHAELDRKVEMLSNHIVSTDMIKLKEAFEYLKYWREMPNRVGIGANALVEKISAISDEEAITYFQTVPWDNWREFFDVGDFEPLSSKIAEEENIANVHANNIEETPIATTPETPPPQNYRLNEQLLNRTSFGEKTRFKDNIEAIKTLKLIETENRAATEDEQEILAKYVGWGGISQAFNKDNPSWGNEYTMLKELLTEQEYREAQSSTLSAFYTNPTVIKAMYEALENIGITAQTTKNNKLNILEPALGVGNFFGMMPEELQQRANLHGVEVDSISARIAQNLYPQANIQNTGYEETYAKDYFDMVIGNVPFGDFKLIDKQNPEISGQNFRIHDHFFAKALDQVKPGGVVAFITSSGTMDKETTKTRRYIAERAELLGAVRLPNNAFKGIANTEVTSDIIFLQRRAEPLNLAKVKEQAEREGKDGEEAVRQLCPWVFTDMVSGINKINGEDTPINSYFINNPQTVLGEMIIDNGNRMHGALIPTCKPYEGMDLAEQLETAMSELKTAEAIEPPTQGYIGTFDVYEGLKTQEHEDVPIINAIPRNFSYVLGNEGSSGEGKIYFYETQGKPLEDVSETFTDLQKERMTGLIRIKDTCRALIEAQLNNHSDEVIKGLQAELNERYDTYANKHGLINGRVAKQLFAEDSSYPLLCALEVLDTDGEFISKSDMFFKRTINPVIEITHADTAEEALILSMSERGGVDIAYMEKLTGRAEAELFSELMGLGKVYKDLRYPIGEKNYEYRTVDEFLSGNVRAKLSKAESLLGELEELLRKENLTTEERLKNRQIQHLAEVFDVDEKLLKALVESSPSENNINEYGRFSEIMASVDRRKAKIFFDEAKGENLPLFRVNAMSDALFRDFVLDGKFDLKMDDIAHDVESAENNEAKTQRLAEITANMETLKYNIAALEKSIPKQLESSDIDVRFGSTWIPPHYIGDFISDKLNLSGYAREGLGITYDKRTSTWGKQQKYTHVDRVLSSEVYGTKRIDAMDIMLDSLNLKDVKIYDPHPDDSKRKVLNYKETVLAQNVQKKIKKEFLDWIWDNPERRADLVEIYNRQFNSIRPREYDGSNLRFTGMSPEVKLKPHQKNAVARILYGGNTLLAHEVGLGKTYEMIAAAMESKRLGLCNKSLVTVPKHLTEQFGSDFLKVYPNANVLIVRENDFTPQNRKKFCAKIATGNYDAIIIAHSQFEKIPLSKARQEQFIQDQLDELEYERDAEDSKSHSERNNFTIKQLEKRKKQLEAKLDELVNQEYKDDTIDFEELGIDRLFVDEAHFMKNLYFPSKLTGIAGLSRSESNRATDMFMKCRYLDEKTGNKGTIFATGTPVSNSLSEMYTMQRFLQYDTLEEHGIYSFDDWASSFGDIITSYEIAPEGNGKYRERRRFAEFFNLPELMNIFTQVADIKTSDTVDIPRPIAHRHTVVAQPDEITKQYIQALSDRAEAVQQKRVSPDQDNMLAITNDGRKIGLDPRLMNNLLPDNPNSKINMCVQNIFDIWNDTKEEKLTQLFFSDLSTPKTGKDAGFNLYDDVREKLVAKGIPREEIKFIHEAKNDAQKKALFEKVRNGEVRVLMGSTEKMGSGTNVQNRLVALHNADCPWRPSDLEQRIGRILRQGNNNKEIHIYNYVTENTFDSYLYQTIENKQKFISQIMTSKEIARRFSDIDETVLNYAEIKALCTGNPLIKDKLDLEREIGNLEIMRKSHTTQRHRLEDMVNTKGPAQLTNYRSRAEDIRSDLEALKQHPYNKEDKDNLPAFTIEGVEYTDRKEAGAALIAACQKNTKEILTSKIGSYRGFEIHARYSFTNSNYELTLKRNHSYTISTGNSTDGNLTRINNALSEVSLIETLEKFEANIKNLEQEIETAKEQLQHSFPQEDEYQAKLARLEEINKELGIGLDKELEQAGKSEAEEQQAREAEKGDKINEVEADKDEDISDIEADKGNEARVFEVLKPNTETDVKMDAADGYVENEFGEDKNSRPHMTYPEAKKKKTVGIAI